MPNIADELGSWMQDGMGMMPTLLQPLLRGHRSNGEGDELEVAVQMVVVLLFLVRVPVHFVRDDRAGNHGREIHLILSVKELILMENTHWTERRCYDKKKIIKQ